MSSQWLVVWNEREDTKVLTIDNTSLFDIEDEAFDHARQVGGVVYEITTRSLVADFTDPVCPAFYGEWRCINDKKHSNNWHVAIKRDTDGSHRFILWQTGGALGTAPWVVPITDALAAKQRREATKGVTVLMTDEPVEVEVLDAEEVASDPVPPPPALFGPLDDPKASVRLMRAHASALAPIISEKHLFKEISGKRHVLVEGWTTLGAMLGVFPVTIWTRELDGNRGWEARVEAHTLAGAVIGAAEAMCTRQEGRWKNADDYAIRSMAQTRATSKALRMPLGFIVTLAGYSETPAEEAYDERPAPAEQPVKQRAIDPDISAGATEIQVKREVADTLTMIPLDTLGAWWEEQGKKLFNRRKKDGIVTNKQKNDIVEAAKGYFEAPFGTPEEEKQG